MREGQRGCPTQDSSEESAPSISVVQLQRDNMASLRQYGRSSVDIANVMQRLQGKSSFTFCLTENTLLLLLLCYSADSVTGLCFRLKFTGFCEGAHCSHRHPNTYAYSLHTTHWSNQSGVMKLIFSLQKTLASENGYIT